MYHFLDESNVDLEGTYPEFSAVWNPDKEELTIFYSGNIYESHSLVDNLTHATSLLENCENSHNRIGVK